MKHYLWYRKNETLGGQIVFGGGVHEEVDLNDPHSTHELTQQLRATYATRPDFGGFCEYECPCPPAQRFCRCAADRLQDSRILGGALVTLPSATFSIGGSNQTPNSVESPRAMPAGQPFELSVVAPSIPDGTQIHLAELRGHNSVRLYPSFPITLTFKGGRSNSVRLVAPPQGMTGAVMITDQLLLRVCRLWILGWSEGQ